MLPTGCIHMTSPGSCTPSQTKAVWQEASRPPGQDNKKQWQTGLPKAGSFKTDHAAAPLGSVPHKCLHGHFYHSAILGVDPRRCCHFPAVLLHSFWLGLAGMGLAGLGASPVTCLQPPCWRCHSARVSSVFHRFPFSTMSHSCVSEKTGEGGWQGQKAESVGLMPTTFPQKRARQNGAQFWGVCIFSPKPAMI